MIDLAEERLPDAIVLPLIPVTVRPADGGRVGDGELVALLRSLAGRGCPVPARYFVMMVFSPDLGFGDVKLAAVTGAFCGWFGWGTVLLGFGAAWITFAVVGMVLLAARKREGKGSFAFGPFMILGSVLGVFWAGAGLPTCASFLGSLAFDQLVERQRPRWRLVAGRAAGHQHVAVGVLDDLVADRPEQQSGETTQARVPTTTIRARSETWISSRPAAPWGTWNSPGHQGTRPRSASGPSAAR